MNVRWMFFGTLAAAALGLSSAAQAADEGWYLAADLGQAHYSGLTGTVNTPAGFTSHTSDNDMGYRLSGGYQFNQYWGAEVGYVDFGQGEINLTQNSPGTDTLSAKVKAHGFVFAGTGTYPFNDTWSGFLRFGAIDGHVENDLSGTGGLAILTGTTSSTDWKVTWGLGVNWLVASNWTVRAGWDQYSSLGNQNTTGEHDVNLLSIGAVYRF